MARSETVTCDGCGKVKGTTDHWFVVTVIDSGDGIRSIILTTGSGICANENSADLCGESCVLKKVSELIGGKA